MPTEDDIIESLEKKFKSNFGMLCVLCLIQKLPYEELNNFAKENDILVKRGIQTKVGFLKSIVAHYYNIFENDSILPGNYNNFLEYVGESLLSYKKFRAQLMHFDFISKQELIDVFADYCADLEITVYDTQEIEKYSLDLFLIRKTPLLRTESVVVLTADEMEEANYEKKLKILEESSKVGTWLVFVTTAAGVYKIGLKKFIEDMERLKVWSYFVVPLHMRIYGVTKGKKSKNLNLELRDDYIQKLPREPTRAPSKVVKISKYKFDEGESYKPKNFITFELWTKGELEMAGKMLEEKPKYQKIFRNVLLIDQISGVSIFSYSSEVQKLDDSLVSGFLQAMDSFVSELGGATSLKEINYQGFFIQAVYGNLIKIALFLSEPADKILQERLAYLIKKLEENYNTQIEAFRLSGDVSFFYGNEEVITLVKEVLKI